MLKNAVAAHLRCVWSDVTIPVPQRAPGPAANWRLELLAVGCALIGIAVRCLPWRFVFADSGVAFLDVDPYYHLRRAQLIVEQFPALPLFDPFISFPWGSAINWPPGFDWLLALPALCGVPWHAVEVWSALLPPLLGGIGVYLVYRLGRQLLDAPAGLVAALLFALLPGAGLSALIGRPDHHALVAPVVVGMYSALLACVRAPDWRRAIGFGLLCGALAAVAVASWVITPPLYFAPIPALLLALRWLEPTPAARRAAWLCLGSALLCVTVAVLLVGDFARKPYDLYQPSLFAVGLFAIAAMVVIASHGRRSHWIATGAALAAGLVALAVAQPQLLEPLAEAWSVVADRSVNYQLMLESRSPLFDEGWLSLDEFSANYSYLVLLAPLLWLAFVTTAARNPRRDWPAALLLAGYSAWGLGLLLLQQRFGEYAAAGLCLLYAWVLTAGGRWLWRYVTTHPHRGRARLLAAACAASALAALSPLIGQLPALAARDWASPFRQLQAFAGELRPLLPPPADPTGAPSYGILTGWNDAHPLLYQTGCAVMVTPFGTREGVHANGVGFSILFAADETQAYRQLRTHRLRYLLLSSPLGQVASSAPLAAEPLPELERIGRNADGTLTMQLLPAYGATLHGRLYLADGSAAPVGTYALPPLSHFRLLLETDAASPVGTATVANLKLFEVVAGAHLIGRADPGARCTAELDLRASSGRRLRHAAIASADASGRFELVVPYPTAAWGAPTIPLGRYQVRCGEQHAEVDVSESQVQEGTAVQIP